MSSFAEHCVNKYLTSPSQGSNMVIDNKMRSKLQEFLPNNYRLVVSQQVQCHPNTVYNVLHNAHHNPAVAKALFDLAAKEKEKRLKADLELKQIAEQL